MYMYQLSIGTNITLPEIITLSHHTYCTCENGHAHAYQRKTQAHTGTRTVTICEWMALQMHVAMNNVFATYIMDASAYL